MLKPQLAVDVNFEKMRYPLMGFRKVDGVRGGHLTGQFTGRSLKPFDNKFTTEFFSRPQYAWLDGELTADGRLTGEDLCSLTGSYTKRHEGEPYLQWNVFEFLAPGVVDLPYYERYCQMKQYVEQAKLERVHVLDFVWIENAEQAKAFYDECLALKFEGAIYRDPKAMHKSGRATETLNDFWRLKPVSDKDALVTGLEEGTKNNNEKKVNALGRTERSSHKANKVPNGMIGTILATDVLTGQPIRIAPGTLKHEDRVRMFKNPELIVGHYIKYTSMDTGIKDAPRQARYKCHRDKSDIS